MKKKKKVFQVSLIKKGQLLILVYFMVFNLRIKDYLNKNDDIHQEKLVQKGNNNFKIVIYLDML